MSKEGKSRIKKLSLLALGGLSMLCAADSEPMSTAAEMPTKPETTTPPSGQECRTGSSWWSINQEGAHPPISTGFSGSAENPELWLVVNSERPIDECRDLDIEPGEGTIPAGEGRCWLHTGVGPAEACLGEIERLLERFEE